ncbi:MAG: DUF3368 domain-containing protein, partial [Desulfobacterales bacterium]
NLGRGEAESISLASEMGLTLVLDDLKARKIAETLDLRITGTIGVLLKAENMTFIKSAYDKTIELRDKGFYVSDKLLEEISRFKASDTNSNP